MTDYSELKRLAEASLRNWPDSKIFERPECDRFIDAARPDVVLAMIAEVERLSGECEGCPMSVAEELRVERDQLKAENEAMRSALDNAAKGILWLQASVPMSIRISKRASKDYSAAKRAAMSKADRSDG